MPHSTESIETFSTNFLEYAQNPEKWLFNLTLCNLQQGPFGFILKKRCSLFFSAFKDAISCTSMGDFDLPQKIKNSYAKIDPAGALDPKTMFMLNIYSTQLQWLFFSQSAPVQNTAVDFNESDNCTNVLEDKTQKLIENLKDEYKVSFKNESAKVKVAPIVKAQIKPMRTFSSNKLLNK